MHTILTKLSRDPLRVIGSIGALCALLGASMVVIVVSQKIAGDSEEFYGRQLLLNGLTLVVVGVQIMGLTLVGWILARIADWWKQTGSK